MTGNLRVLVSHSGENAIVTLIGEAHTDMEEAHRQIRELTEKRPKVVVVDASQLTFLASVGMQWMLNLREQVTRGGGKLRIAAMHPMIQTALRHARILDLFEVYPDLAAALAAGG